MRVTVVGSGYVGLVASACLANLGHDVNCVDHDAAKIKTLLAGDVPIYEPGLDTLIAAAVRDGKLTFGTSLKAAMKGAEIAFIAVGTPDRKDDGKPDLTNVYAVAGQIGDVLTSHCVVVNKSTVPVGTGDVVEKILSERCSRSLFDVVSNPEFLREGHAIDDFNKPDRIVVGVETEKARAVMAQLYSPDQFGEAPTLYTRRRTAELMKYAANAFLAAKVAFINDIAELCEHVGANVDHVSQGMGLDVRIGKEFLRPGPGFGGSCLPKDTRALVRAARECGAPSTLFNAIVHANESRKRDLAYRVMAALGGSVAGRVIALLGLTFKANTDDMRESPALALIKGLQDQDAKVRAYDPAGMPNASRMVDGVSFAGNPYDCVEGASAIVLVTDWPEFKNLDLSRMRDSAAEPIILDLRNLYNSLEMQEGGWTYFGTGREVSPSGLEDIKEFRASRIANISIVRNGHAMADVQPAEPAE